MITDSIHHHHHSACQYNCYVQFPFLFIWRFDIYDDESNERYH